MGKVYVVGTFDTKALELGYIADIARSAGADVVLVDVSTGASEFDADVRPADVAACSPGTQVLGLTDRGQAVAAMSAALVRFITERSDIDGIVSAGGSGGTALVTAAMRALPIGLPKVMVSTVASGNVAPYVGPNDICMMYSVTDVAGLNRISRQVLANAALAVVGMSKGRIEVPAAERAAVGLTMFGVTTTCVKMVSAALEPQFDCLVFHATGTGGQSFEKLVDSGLLVGGLDVTTTEVCDLLVGGVFPCTEDRFGAFIRTGTPYVGSCGALDMVNFGAIDTVPERFRDRTLYIHNPQVTLMRTTPEENARMGTWIAERLNQCDGSVRFLIPELGVSAIDRPGQPFHDPDADRALFGALQSTFRQTSDRRLISLPHHINDAAFAAALVSEFTSITA